MAGKSSSHGVATLVALGVGCIAVGIFVVKAGAGTRVSRNSYGQLSTFTFLIPIGVTLLALALVHPLDRLHRYLALRRAVREQRRRAGPGSG